MFALVLDLLYRLYISTDRARAEGTFRTTVDKSINMESLSAMTAYAKCYVKTEAMARKGDALRRGQECPKP